MAVNQKHAAIRVRGVKLALITSLAGKGLSSVVQLAALPLAIRALGQEKYGVYAVLAALLNWMAIASVTITPGLTMQLVSAHARADRREEARIFGSALILSTVVAAVLYVGSQFLLRSIGVVGIFGENYSAFTGELYDGVEVLSAFIAMNLILCVAEATQAGYQKQYVHNMFIAAGNIITIVAILLLVRAKPTITNMIIAFYAGPLVARALSLIQLLSVHRYLVGGVFRVELSAMFLIVTTGSAFLLTGVASFCYQSFSVYWVGRWGGPIAATHMSVFITLLSVAGSILMMFLQPLWPAIRDATVRDEFAWIAHTYSRIRKYLMLYVGAAAFAVAIAGNQITHIWVGAAIATSISSQILLALYFLALAWEQCNYSFLIGLGSYWFAALAYLIGSMIMLVSSAFLVPRFGVSGMLAAMCLGPLLVTAWAYPVKLHRLLYAQLANSRAATSSIPNAE
jgi:O-antigen/teichoic acid export membrane protein